MRFLLDPEQRAFADSLHAMLTAADTPSVARDWSLGERASGRALWSRLAEAGVFGLAVPEAYGGFGPLPVELAVAFVELGRHAVPGPLVETVAAAALLTALDDTGPAKRLLPELASGETTATLAVGAARMLDADAADVLLTAAPSHGPTRAAEADPAKTRTAELRLAPPVRSHAPIPSLDPTRRLFPSPTGGELLAAGPQVAAAVEQALARARLATAAQALGVGLALLDKTVAYVRQRTQFGVPVGSFQAVKHRLADAAIALEFARPLVFGAALTRDPADVAAAKLTACEAAYTTARAALQLHGAIGYTAEYELSLWLTKARVLRTAWGGPDACRDLVLSGGDRRW
ncbi:acyl-CoA dehydrogenase family protein [Streptomyces sp. NPDC005209]|uniref:acyl-CoA dehydrogenase family protein n=1 Tax=Streptomyces sp. NPDC005209 TaxID=3156715 RepID=UPI0033A44B1B